MDLQQTLAKSLLCGLRWAPSLVALSNPLRGGTLGSYTLQLREVGVQPNHSQYQIELVWKESDSRFQTLIHEARGTTSVQPRLFCEVLVFIVVSSALVYIPVSSSRV